MGLRMVRTAEPGHVRLHRRTSGLLQTVIFVVGESWGPLRNSNVGLAVFSFVVVAAIFIYIYIKRQRNIRKAFNAAWCDLVQTASLCHWTEQQRLASCRLSDVDEMILCAVPTLGLNGCIYRSRGRSAACIQQAGSVDFIPSDRSNRPANLV